MTSHLVRSLSSVSRVHNHQHHHHHHQQQHQNNSHNYRRSTTQRLVSLSPINQNRDSSIDASLLAHENPNHCCDLASPLPLDQYKLNVDRNPHVVRRKPNEKVHYNQQIAVRYLKPPPPPKGGDIVIRELPAKQVAPAPALVVRQAPPKPCTPPPLIIREAPPCPPNPLPGKVLHVPGKVYPPPTRKVVVERLPPVPSKPQQVFIERWLPYSQPTQRIVYQPAKQPCLLPEPRNVVIQWETPDVEIRREVKHLGVVLTDPVEYVKRYGPGLVRSHQLPDIAHKYANVSGLHLAANYQPPLDVPILEGDVHALKLIDLDQVGLGRLKSSPVVSSTSHYHTAPREEHIVLSPLPYRIPTPVNSHSSAAAAINAAINSIATTAATNTATVAAPTATDASSILVGSTGCPDEEIYLSSYNSDHQQQSTTTHHSSAQQESSQSQESGAGNTTQSILNTLSS